MGKKYIVSGQEYDEVRLIADEIEPRPNPAPYSRELLEHFAGILIANDVRTVLDPFAGTGRIFELEKYTPHLTCFAVEIEPEWAVWHPRTVVGDSTMMLYPTNCFDAVLTSPTYANRMGDRTIKGTITKPDGTVIPNEWRTYTSMIGRKLSPNNTGHYQWSSTKQKRKYCDLHCRVYRNMWRIIKPGGIMVLNLKDHYRGERRQRVTLWHTLCAMRLGFEVERTIEVELSGYGYGQNGQSRMDFETITVLRKRA